MHYSNSKLGSQKLPKSNSKNKNLLPNNLDFQQKIYTILNFDLILLPPEKFVKTSHCIKVYFTMAKLLLAEVESSRTHFKVLGLEASSPQKLPCPQLEDSTIFEPLKFRWKTPETLRKICKDLFFWFP